MNEARQFWSLFKFQMTVNPFIWFMPLAFTATLWMPFFIGGYHPSLSSSLVNSNLFFVGFLSVMILAPEIFASVAAQNLWASGTEFLVTRATDRRIIYRSKSAFAYVLILTIPIALMVVMSGEPSLKTEEYSKILRQECLRQLPGSTLAKDKYGSADQLTIPNGNILIKSWNVWVILLTAIASQVLIWTIFPLKYRRYLFWGIYMVIILGPLLMISPSLSSGDRLSVSEKIFFLFATHQALAWTSAILAAALVQLWCERRFAQMEQ